MGLTEALKEFQDFEKFLAETNKVISNFIYLVKAAVEGGFVNPNAPLEEISIEGYVLDIPNSRLYLRTRTKDKGNAYPEMPLNADEIISLYRVLPQLMEEFSKIMITHTQQSIKSRLEKHQGFIFEHSL